MRTCAAPGNGVSRRDHGKVEALTRDDHDFAVQQALPIRVRQMPRHLC